VSFEQTETVSRARFGSCVHLWRSETGNARSLAYGRGCQAVKERPEVP
jgi:hypothetical protein